MAPGFLHLALTCVLLLGASGPSSTHAASTLDDDTDRGPGDLNDVSLEGQHSHPVERSYYGTGYNSGPKLDLYSSLAIFSFAIFLGYLLYNYIRTQQATTTRSLDSGVWSMANSLDLEEGSKMTAKILSSLERWDDLLRTMPRDPTIIDVIGRFSRNLF